MKWLNNPSDAHTMCIFTMSDVHLLFLSFRLFIFIFILILVSGDRTQLAHVSVWHRKQLVKCEIYEIVRGKREEAVLVECALPQNCKKRE